MTTNSQVHTGPLMSILPSRLLSQTGSTLGLSCPINGNKETHEGSLNTAHMPLQLCLIDIATAECDV